MREEKWQQQEEEEEASQAGVLLGVRESRPVGEKGSQSQAINGTKLGSPLCQGLAFPAFLSTRFINSESVALLSARQKVSAEVEAKLEQLNLI